MFRILVTFSVRDYQVWKDAFDAGAGPRREQGITTADILCNVADGNQVVVVFHTDDLERAKAHLSDPEVKKGQMNSGFLAPPELFVAKSML
jgi:hypothetical protein